jgi:hypothetical protein
VPADRLANLFAGFLGSRENALAVVNALRNGTTATLTTTPACAAPCHQAAHGHGSTTLDVPTKPMGWGNVRHALALAQYSLAQAGITNPTPAQIAAALNGGTVTTSAGKPVELRGVLTMRASGMGWGNIARAEGTTMGNVNHGLKPFNAVTHAAHHDHGHRAGRSAQYRHHARLRVPRAASSRRAAPHPASNRGAAS